MDYILNIHTATDTAIVNLTYGQKLLGTKINHNPREHAGFLHQAILDLLKKEGVLVKNLSAIGISTGPGSYTGVRVGLATAYGLGYSLKIPLIPYNSLEIMAKTAINFIRETSILYCPMIDAKRMEVFTALYDYQLQEIMPPSAMVLNENSFEEYLSSFKVAFCGSGSKKFQKVSSKEKSYFIDAHISSESIAEISLNKYKENDFHTTPYPQPLYIKNFYTILK
jgi:tRNA threonylcarbamoyladenosine biosynthesis protein TsaB